MHDTSETREGSFSELKLLSCYAYATDIRRIELVQGLFWFDSVFTASITGDGFPKPRMMMTKQQPFSMQMKRLWMLITRWKVFIC